MNQLLTRLKKQAGLTGHANPHSFRHGFAKDYLMNGGDLASLADLMGHESVETTESFYAVFEQADLRRKHDQFSVARWGSRQLERELEASTIYLVKDYRRLRSLLPSPDVFPRSTTGSFNPA